MAFDELAFDKLAFSELAFDKLAFDEFAFDELRKEDRFVSTNLLHPWVRYNDSYQVFKRGFSS
jgi:hypothetical protein